MHFLGLGTSWVENLLQKKIKLKIFHNHQFFFLKHLDPDLNVKNGFNHHVQVVDISDIHYWLLVINNALLIEFLNYILDPLKLYSNSKN